MGIINRFLLFVYTICMGIVSVIVAGICLNLIPEHIWLNEIRFAVARPEVLAVLAAVFLLSLYLLSVSVSTTAKQKEKTPTDLLLVEGESGGVRVSVAAVQNMAERAVSTIRGVREAHVKVRPLKDGEKTVSLALQMVLTNGVSVPETGQHATEIIREELARTLNLAETKVDVSVSDISNAPVDRKRVV